MRKTMFCLFVMTAMLSASLVRADKKGGQKAFKEGAALFKQGEYERASLAFRRSYDAYPNWKIWHNIGECEEAAGQFGAAADAFQKYLAEGGDNIDAKARKSLTKQVTQLKSRQLFLEGADFFEHKQFEDAAVMFRKAYETNPHWKVLYNIAQSETAARHYGRAMEAFEKYLSLGGDEISAERQNEVAEELDRLQRLVGFVVIDAPEGTQVFIDDVNRGTTPLSGNLMVAAGVVHELKIVQGDRELHRQKIKVNGRQTISVAVQTTHPPATSGTTVAATNAEPSEVRDENRTTGTAAPDTTAATAASKWQKRMMPTGVALMATGGALVVGSLITGAVLLKRRNDLEEPCKDGCPPSEQDKNDGIADLARAGNVLLFTGVGVAAAGAALFIIGKKRFGTERMMAMTPDVAPHGAGAMLTGRF